MSRLNRNDRKWLEGKFGDRANFNPTERVLYGHDIAAIPSLFKPLVGRTVPDAVIQPETEEELRELVCWANGRRISLVPRGKGSSGYGGLIPIRKGLVVDFFRMKNVLSVDVTNETATVQAGITWEQLDRALEPHGLTLRLYPTSYPSSSAGGWLAQGGAGIGSYAYGWFLENVISARVVLPDGEVKEFTGKDLELISEAEGTTGVISQVTVQVMKREELGLTAIACPDAHRLTKVFQEFISRALPLWSVVFINPRMAEMKNRAPVRMHLGHPAEHKVILPAAYIAVLAYRAADREKVVSQLPDILHDCMGEVLSQQIAEHEWENRFKLMIVKRLGPSLVPAEIVVPLENLGKVMEEIEHRINQPIVKEGVIIRTGRDGKPEAVILGFIPSDQRRFSYNFVFGLVLSIIKIAEKYGGRPYSTGLYFVRKAKQILGEDRVLRLKAFQKKVDRKRIPARSSSRTWSAGPSVSPKSSSPWSGHSGISSSLKWANASPPSPSAASRRTWPGTPIPAPSAVIASTNVTSSTAGAGKANRPGGNGTGCASFWRAGPSGTSRWSTPSSSAPPASSATSAIEPSWMKLRGKLIHDEKRMTFPPFEMMAAALQDEGNIWAGYRKDRTQWFPEELKSKHGPSRKCQNVYFGGCTVSYVEHDIGQAAVTLLDAAGVDFNYLGNVENCCGTPMLVAGKWEIFAENMKRNIAAVKAAGADTVISSCPACDMMWRNVYPEWAKTLGIEYGITARHYSEVVSEKIKDGSFKFTHPVKKRVTWHDSCHIGRVSGVYEPPRDVIKAVPGVEFVEMTHHHDEAHCCGSVLTLLKDPLIAHDVGETRLHEATAVKAETVLALCPCCEFQLRVSKEKKNTPIEVRDLAAFACEGLGRKFADPSPEVSRQWKVFESMIALMTPQGFANLMDTMWPEMLKAMPLGMGGMMKAIGKLGPLGGAMFALMKPLFPVLFPKLLPGMMPKVMPTMLERIGAIVPMPDYMAEQMPEMMPKVMDNLMPHMLPDVVPLAVPKMVAYLRGRA
jgi:Fe-S oxidoreductase/FAD/FMN-containing dehydrogenase